MKKYAGIIILLFSTLAINAQNLNDSLLLHYTFQGNANDISGNGYNGAIINATPTTDHMGIPNSAYYFNGINSYIELPAVQKLKPPLPISIAFWVKFDDLTAAHSQIFITDYTLNTYTGVWFGLNPSTQQMQISYGMGTTGCTGIGCRRTKQGTTVLQTGTWYNIIGILRGPLDMSIYINCREEENGVYTGSGGDIAYTNNPGSLGRTDQANFNPYYFKGSLDDFRYWNRELNLADIDLLCSSAYSISDYLANPHQFNLYPNPASDVLTLESKADISNAEYDIRNMLGQSLINGKLTSGNSNNIAISGLASGLYFLTIKIDGQLSSIKFAKE